MRLIIDDENVLHPHQFGHDALEHLPFCFERLQVGAVALEKGACPFGQVERLAQLECVVVGNDDLGAIDIRQHVARDQLPTPVIAVGIVRLQNTQTVLNRDARCDDQKSAREVLAVRAANGVDRLPGDDHGHDRGLAGAGGQFQSQTKKLRVCLRVRRGEMVQELATVLRARRDLSQPDCGLNRFDLTEEGADSVELVVAPVLKQSSSLGRNVPLTRILEFAPAIYMLAQLIDDRDCLVSLLLGREADAFIEDNLSLSLLLFLRLGDRGDELGAATTLQEPVGGLTLLVEFPVFHRVFVGRVDDRFFEEGVGHFGFSPGKIDGPVKLGSDLENQLNTPLVKLIFRM